MDAFDFFDPSSAPDQAWFSPLDPDSRIPLDHGADLMQGLSMLDDQRAGQSDARYDHNTRVHELEAFAQAQQFQQQSQQYLQQLAPHPQMQAPVQQSHFQDHSQPHSHPHHSIPQQQQPPSQPLQEQQIQLDILRETRRIRELELKIAEERRFESEARLREREIEATIATGNVGLTATSQRSTPSAASPPTSSTNSQSQPQSEGNADWLNPSVQDLFSFFVPGPTASGSSSGSGAQSPGATAARVPPAAAPKKRSVRAMEERDANCAQCGAFIARLLLRGSRAELDTPFETVFQCQVCAPVKVGSASRKRASQLEDTDASTICDVCTHVQGHGGFRPKGRSVLSFLVEVICASCLEKYRRCSNCGGGSARGGIGKWRCKELFENNRKTCSLSHTRLGARDMELAVWAFPDDVRDRKEFPALLEASDNLWREHLLAKMAVPEVLEHQNGFKSYAEINEKVIQRGFLARDLLTADPMSPNHRTYVAYVWAKARARRDKSRPEWAQSRAEDKSTEEWVAYNTRRSTVLYPANSVLCGVWIAEWVIKDRTLAMATMCPFDYVDIEDRSPFAFGEVLYRALTDAREHNAAHPDDLWEAPEHVWVTVKSDAYALRMRLVETLERRLGFMPLDEYLVRYPGTTREMFSPSAANMAHLVNSRDTGDGRAMTVVAKYLGKSLSLETMDKVREAHLVRKPRVEAKFDD